MNLRLALYRLAGTHALDGNAIRSLHRLAGLNSEPPEFSLLFPRIIAVLAAALLGIGLILWVAANWGTFGRVTHFALLQTWVLLAYLGALRLPSARKALALLAFLGTGALLAYFGQTYQTGADPWQLFAIWSLLVLPLALAVRSDVLWSPWSLVATTAIALWMYTQLPDLWRLLNSGGVSNSAVYVMAWIAALLVAAGLSRLGQRYTGAGLWGFRSAVTMALIFITLSALFSLLQKNIPGHYGVALLLLAGMAACLVDRAFFDVYAMSAALLSLNILLIGGLVHLMFVGKSNDPITRLFFIGLIAAMLLAASVSLLLHLVRSHRQAEEQA